jgi:hypothetical protein
MNQVKAIARYATGRNIMCAKLIGDGADVVDFFETNVDMV